MNDDTQTIQQTLVGAAIADGANTLSRLISLGITEKDFTSNSARMLWELAKERYDKNEPFDELSLGPSATAKGGSEILVYMGRAVDLGELNIHQLDHYSGMVKANSRRIELKRLALRITESVGEPLVETGEIVAMAEKKLLDISSNGTAKSMVSVFDSAMTSAENLVNRLRRKGEIFIKSGFNKIDEHIGGFRNKNLYIIAARPAKGKTALGLGIAKNIASSQERIPAYFISLEMGHDELTERLISSETKINLRDLDTGFIPKQQWDKTEQAIRQASERIGKIPLTIDDQSDMNIDTIRSRCRHLKAMGKCKIVFIDYLQLVRSKPNSRTPRHEVVAEITRGLKQMAKELDIPVVALCQLNRELEKEERKPRVSDLRESGSIEQDADCIMLLHQKLTENGVDPTEEDRTDRGYHMWDEIGIFLGKFRQGETADFSMGFRKKWTLFTDHIESLKPKPEPKEDLF